MKSSHIILLIGVLIIAVLIGMNMQDEPTLGESIENAADEVSDGVEDAAEELDRDRSAGEKVGDAIEDAGEEIEDAAQ